MKIFYFLINIISVFIFPWYVPVLLFVVSIFIFEEYYYSVFIGFILDIFYGKIGQINLFFTISLPLIYILSLFIKDRIRIGFYAK